MKKFLIALVVLAALIAGGAYVVTTKGEGVVRDLVVTEGSAALQTKVALDAIKISPFDGRLALSGFALHQPKGFGDGVMVGMDDFSVGLDVMSLTSDHIKINSIILDAPVLNAIYMDGKTNFTAMQDVIGTSEETAPSTLRMSVQTLALKNMQVSFQMDDGKPKKITLADIILSDIGVDEGGVPPKDIMRHLMDALEPQIAKAAVKLGLKSKAKDVVDEKLKKELGIDTDKAKKKLKDLLGGFKKKKDG